MAGGPNNLDYSNLNKSLNLKGDKLKDITTKVSEDIGEMFLKTNPNRVHRGDKEKVQKLERFSYSINSASEGAKAKFVLNIDYLSKNKLLKADSIKSLKLRILEDDTKSSDDKLENILSELTKNLSESDRLKLDQHVSKELLNLSEQADSADKLGEKITDLEQQNSDLKGELDALDAVSEVAEKAVLTRRSRSNTIRVGKSIEKITDNNKGLDPVTKARKVLRQANSYAVFGSGKRFDLINKLPKKIDVNKEYKEVVDKLKTKMDGAEDREKVAIRYIMRQVNNAYKEYIDATNISEDTRKQNMRDINQKMAA